MKAVIYNNSESRYSTVFWGKDKNREYEHEADQLAIRQALKGKISAVVDLGGGFGRLVPTLKEHAERVIIVDSSLDLLEEARERFQDDPNVQYVRANLYHLPFRTASIQTAICLRVMHHIDDPDALFRELNRVVNGNLYLEFPNKKHLLQLFRWFFKRDERVDIFSSRPEIRDRMFYNFTLQYMRSHLLRQTIFAAQTVHGISFMRHERFKRHLSLQTILIIEKLLQHVPVLAEFAPSIMLSLSKRHLGDRGDAGPSLVCPRCYGLLAANPEQLSCEEGHRFSSHDQIVDLYVE